MKAKVIMEEVSSGGMEKPVEKRHWRQIACSAKEKRTADLNKSPCKSVEQEECYENGLRWSWASNQMGNVR